jgi:hypothetical protein
MHPSFTPDRAMAYPLPFLTSEFIDDSLTGDEASFDTALLNAQHIPPAG